MSYRQVVSRFKKIKRLSINYDHITDDIYEHEGSIQLPTSLVHLELNHIYFDDVDFLSNLTQLKSLKLIDVNVSNDTLAYIAQNLWELQSFKINCEF